LSIVVLLLIAAPAAAGAPRIRGTSARDNALIRETLERSATARELAAALESTDVIAYVQLTPAEPAGRAATRFVVATSTSRFVRIVVGVTTPMRDRVPLLAHELQHVLEIGLAPDVRDDEGLRQLYRRIGESRSALFAFETSAAREVSARVRREMTGAAPPAAPAAAGSPPVEAALASVAPGRADAAGVTAGAARDCDEPAPAAAEQVAAPVRTVSERF
jgi:hypothetical protein